MRSCVQQGTRRTANLLYLPECVPSMFDPPVNPVQRAHMRQLTQLLAVQLRHAKSQIFCREKRSNPLALARDRVCSLGPQTFHVAHAKSNRQGAIHLSFDRALRLRTLHVDSSDAKVVPLCVLHQDGWHIEAHRLVEHGIGEGRKILHLEEGRSIREQRKLAACDSVIPSSAND
jgi:hypothetical protein